MTLQVLKLLICTCYNMSQNQDSKSKTREDKPLISDDSSSDDSINNTLNVTEEEKQGTIPSSTVATAMALAGERAQNNPIVERGPPHRRKKSKVKSSTVSESTQTTNSEKASK